MQRTVLLAVAVLLALPAGAAGHGWASNAGNLLYTSEGDLWVHETNATKTPGEGEAQGAWDPHGERIAFRAGTSPYRIGLLRFNQYERTMLPGAPGFHESQPAWSPDGARIVYRRSVPSDNDSGDVWVMNADGGGKRSLVASALDERYPSFSRDGTKLVFTRGGDIWVADAEGGGQTQITTGPAIDSAPAWSFDDKRIAFERGSGQDAPDNEIWTAASVGGDERRLTHNDVVDEGPSWSPPYGGGGGGQRIAWTHGTLDAARIWTMRADGTEQARADRTHEARQESPDWQAMIVIPNGGGPATTPSPPPPPPPPQKAPDHDGDGLDATTERQLGTSDVDLDSDDDGLRDRDEVQQATCVRPPMPTILPPCASPVIPPEGNPRRFDTDRDGLSDGVERAVRRPVADPPGPVLGTDPRRFRRDRDPRSRTDAFRRDTDRDGLRDGREDRNRNGRRDRLETDATRRDTDRDGLSDRSDRRPLSARRSSSASRRTGDPGRR